MSWKYVQYENGKYKTTSGGGGGGGGNCNVWTGTTSPTSADGDNGDIWFEIKSSMSYLRMTIYKNRNDASVTQLSDIRLNDGNDNYYAFTGASISGNKSGFSGEGVDQLIDNNTATKYCTQNTPSTLDPIIITITFASAVSIYDYPYFEYWTANDSDERDPISFDIDISTDGTNYYNILSEREIDIPTSRQVLGYQANIKLKALMYQKMGGSWHQIEI